MSSRRGRWDMVNILALEANISRQATNYNLVKYYGYFIALLHQRVHFVYVCFPERLHEAVHV